MYNQKYSSSFSPLISSPSVSNFATQRWNLILTVFHNQMPLKLHWKYLWPYDNSFTGTEAVDFLLINLSKLLIDKIVTRAKCSQLLQKFLSRGFIFNVRCSTDKEFTEKNGEVYRFDDAKIEYEISKTSNSTFCEPQQNAILQRSLSNPEQEFRQPFKNRNGNFTSPNAFVRSATIFSSFRNLKRSSQPAQPVFRAPPPPPPSSPPRPSKHSEVRFRKRDMSQFSPPQIQKKHARFSHF